MTFYRKLHSSYASQQLDEERSLLSDNWYGVTDYWCASEGTWLPVRLRNEYKRQRRPETE